MKKIKLYVYFFIVSIVFLMISFYCSNSETTIDINVHDTYYVIHHSYLSILFALFYALVGFMYLIFKISKIKLINILTKIHSIITLSSVPLYFVGLEIINLKPDSYFPLFNDVSNSYYFITIIGILFLLAQFLFILNVAFGLIKHLFFKK